MKDFNPNPNSALHNCSRHEVKYAMDEQRKDCKVCTWFALAAAKNKSQLGCDPETLFCSNQIQA